MDISLDYYRIFYEIVKAGSFSHAAKNLYVSQSSVSQSLAKLEEAMGITLIERTTKKMKLTDAGKLLYDDLSPAIEAIQAAQQKVKRLVRMEEGSVNIGVSDTICRYFLMPYLSAFKSNYPNIHLSLSNRPSSISVNALINGELDLAVVNLMPSMNTPSTEIRPLAAFKEVFIVKESSELNDQTPLETWLKHPFISLEKGATTRDFIACVFEKHGFNFEPVIELSSLDLIFDFVVHGFGVGIVPEYALPLHENVRSVPIPIDMPKREIGIVTSSKMPQNIATKQFIGELSQQVKRQR